MSVCPENVGNWSYSPQNESEFSPICNYPELFPASVVVSPLPGADVMICSKYPIAIPGRRYRLPGGVIVSPPRSEAIRRASN